MSVGGTAPADASPLLKPAVFAIRVPHTPDGFGGVYYRCSGNSFRRLPDRLSQETSDLDAASVTSTLQGHEAERSEALDAPQGSYSKLGTLVLGEGFRAEECGYTGGVRPAMVLNLHSRDTNTVVAIFIDSQGAERGSVAFDHLTAYEATTSSEGWLVMSLHDYSRDTGDRQRAAAGRWSVKTWWYRARVSIFQLLITLTRAALDSSDVVALLIGASLISNDLAVANPIFEVIEVRFCIGN